MSRTSAAAALLTSCGLSVLLVACGPRAADLHRVRSAFDALPAHKDLMDSVRKLVDGAVEPPEGLLLTGATANMWHDVALRDASLMGIRPLVKGEPGEPLVLVEWGSASSADHCAFLLIDRGRSGRLLYTSSDFDPTEPCVHRSDVEEYTVSASEMAAIRRLMARATFVGDYGADVSDGAGYFVSYWEHGKCDTVASWSLEYTDDLDRMAEDGEEFPRETAALSELVSRVVAAFEKAWKRREGADKKGNRR